MTDGIDEAAYLDWALEAAPGEVEERERLLGLLPQAIVDVHAHANGIEAVRSLSEEARTQVRTSFPSWSLDDSIPPRYGTSCSVIAR